VLRRKANGRRGRAIKTLVRVAASGDSVRRARGRPKPGPGSTEPRGAAR